MLTIPNFWSRAIQLGIKYVLNTLDQDTNIWKKKYYKKKVFCNYISKYNKEDKQELFVQTQKWCNANNFFSSGRQQTRIVRICSGLFRAFEWYNCFVKIPFGSWDMKFCLFHTQSSHFKNHQVLRIISESAQYQAKMAPKNPIKISYIKN